MEKDPGHLDPEIWRKLSVPAGTGQASPESIVLDRGLESRRKLQQLILLRYIGVESAYQLGRGERQGGIPDSYAAAKTWSSW